MQFLAIVILCVFSSIVYGILHDQVTARICVEYFTIGHPPIFNTSDPTLLGFGWGVIATWWIGLLLGVPIALIARVGNRPKRGVFSLIRPVAALMAAMAICALLAGITGWLLARSGKVFLVSSIAAKIPHDKHVLFIADLWSHSTSYLVGFIGAVVLMFHVWRSRGRAAFSQNS